MTEVMTERYARKVMTDMLEVCIIMNNVEKGIHILLQHKN